MKLSDILGSLGRIADLASHAHTITSIFGAIGTGKDLPEDAPPLAKGMHGILGKGDEREWQNLLQKLESEDRDIITGFFQWYFKGEEFADWILIWWAQNNLRSFITGLGHAQGSPDGKRKSTVITKKEGTIARTVTDRELRTRGYDNRLAFLKMMVNIIKSEEGDNPEKGYEKLVAYFESHGVPTIPDNIRTTVKKVLGDVGAASGSIQERLERLAQIVTDKAQERRDQAKQRLWLNRFILRILP